MICNGYLWDSRHSSIRSVYQWQKDIPFKQLYVQRRPRPLQHIDVHDVHAHRKCIGAVVWSVHLYMAANNPSVSSEANDSGQLMWHSCVLTLCFHSYLPEHWNLSSGIEIRWWHVHTDIVPRQRAHNPCKDHPQKSKEARDTIRITWVQCVVDSVSHDSFPALSRTCPTSVQVSSPTSPEKFPHSSWYVAVSASSLTTPDLMDPWEAVGFCYGYGDGVGFPCTALTNFVAWCAFNL